MYGKIKSSKKQTISKIEGILFKPAEKKDNKNDI